LGPGAVGGVDGGQGDGGVGLVASGAVGGQAGGELPAGLGAEDGDMGGVGVEVTGMGFDPGQGGQGVVAGSGPGDVGTPAVVGGEDGEAVVGEVARGGGPVGFAAGVEVPAVQEK
jgi:hypothetical protein